MRGLGDVVAPSAFSTGVWHLVTATRSGTTLQLYLDAASVGTPATVSSGAITTDMRNLGSEGRWVQDNFTTPTTNIYFAASMDEARASNVARDIDWITTDYNNQNSPTTFLTATRPESAPATARSRRTRPPPSTFCSLDATASCAGTTIAWQMAQGFDTLGFNVFREANGARVKLNDGLVPAKALSGGAGETLFVRRPGTARVGRASTGSKTSRSRWTAGGTAPSRRSRRRTARRSRCPVRSARGVPTASPAGAGPAAPGESATATRSAAVPSRARAAAVRPRVPLALVALALARSPSPEAVMIGALTGAGPARR